MLKTLTDAGEFLKSISLFPVALTVKLIADV